MRIRVFGLFAALSLAAGLVPQGAGANHCGGSIVVFSGNRFPQEAIDAGVTARNAALDAYNTHGRPAVNGAVASGVTAANETLDEYREPVAEALPDEAPNPYPTQPIEQPADPVPTTVGVPTGPVWVNSGAVSCSVLAHDYDGRIINPGATHFSIRFTQDLGEGVAALTAVVNGMGFVNNEITLARGLSTLNTCCVYDSARMPFADPASTQQYLAVSLQILEDDAPLTTCFHTVIGTCPPGF